MESTLRLFKAVPINKRAFAQNDFLAAETLASGFVFAPEVIAEYSTTYLRDLVNRLYGRNSQEWNQAFHKSFSKVRDSSFAQLVTEQLAHYWTTYGREALGIYDESFVWTPAERLDAPELAEGIRVVIIRGLTHDELKEKLLELLETGVALSEQTVEDVLDVAGIVQLQEADLARVANKEVRAALYDHLGIVPSNPVEFLRFLVYKATDKTLLIKSPALIAQIKQGQHSGLVRYFDIYEKQVGLERLAEIFNRFKPIWLAFRTNTALKRRVNRIRRLAKTHHKPMQEDLVGNLTGKLARAWKTGEVVQFKDLHDALEGVNTFRKVRLAYALRFRMSDPESIVYRVRNGKSWVTNVSYTRGYADYLQKYYDIVLESIFDDVRANVWDKKIFIPAGVKYALPATEKQFTGNLPIGTHVVVDQDMVCGIHWTNVGGHRIDLDLAMMSAGRKIGWDGAYRDKQNDIYFSGDNTTAPAPRGASELFHIGAEARGAWLMNVNYYNFYESVDVPFKIVVASETRRNITRDYVIDPNKIVAFSNSVMDTHQRTLGFVVADEDSTRFYFTETDIGGGITSRLGGKSEQARQYLLSYFTDTISLNDVLVAAGAELVDDPSLADIDLSIEAIDKTTILQLLS